MNNPNRVPPTSFQPADLVKLKAFLVNAITREMEADPPPLFDRERVIKENLAKIFQQTRVNLPETLRQQLFHDIQDDLLGYGPIQPLLDDPSITEVMVNGYKKVYIERKGKLTKTNVTFENDEHVLRIIDRIVLPLGRRIDPDSPTVDARLPDGSRVNAIIPPVALDGPSITIRKFSKEQLTVQQLIDLGSITPQMAEFLKACVISKLNIVISGGTGSGKTTLLNILSRFIPEEDRIVTIEDAAELRLQQDHTVRLKRKPPTWMGPDR